jgi:hypothetical protein
MLVLTWIVRVFMLLALPVAAFTCGWLVVQLFTTDDRYPDYGMSDYDE